MELTMRTVFLTALLFHKGLIEYKQAYTNGGSINTKRTLKNRRHVLH